MKKSKKSLTKNLNKRQKYILDKELKKSKYNEKKENNKFINKVIEMLFF
jgi:hypothetical protein